MMPGIDAQFVVDDLTKLSLVEGPFDLLLDYGALNDRPPTQRDAYTSNVLFSPRDRMSVGSSPSVSPTLSDNRAVTPAGN